MVGTQMAVPRAAVIRFRISSGFIGHARGLQADEHRGRALALAAQPVVLGDQVHVVRPFQPRVRHAEDVEQRLGEADHGVPRVLRVLVLLAAQQTDHVEDRHLAVHRDAADRVHARVEPGAISGSRDAAPLTGLADKPKDQQSKDPTAALSKRLDDLDAEIKKLRKALEELGGATRATKELNHAIELLKKLSAEKK